MPVRGRVQGLHTELALRESRSTAREEWQRVASTSGVSDWAIGPLLLSFSTAAVFVLAPWMAEAQTGSTGKAATDGSNAKLTWIRSIGVGEKGAEQRLRRPKGVAADSRDRIFVANPGPANDGKVLIFDREGAFLGRLGKTGASRGEVAQPVDVGVGPDDSIYVTDIRRNVLLKFGSDLGFKREVAQDKPLAVWATDSKVYVTTSSQVIILDKDLRVLDKWGKRGKAVGEFDFPNGVAVLNNGTVVVSDGVNRRLQALLDGKGRAAWVVGKPPESLFDRSSPFGLPAGLTLDADQNIYVADPLGSRIYILDDQGKKLAECGTVGHGKGQFYFPSDIAYLGGDEFAVADTQNDRVEIVTIAGPWSGTATVDVGGVKVSTGLPLWLLLYFGAVLVLPVATLVGLWSTGNLIPRVDIGHRPDMTANDVLQIFSRHFEGKYGVREGRRGSGVIVTGSAWSAVVVSLIQRSQVTELRLSGTFGTWYPLVLVILLMPSSFPVLAIVAATAWRRLLSEARRFVEHAPEFQAGDS